MASVCWGAGVESPGIEDGEGMQSPKAGVELDRQADATQGCESAKHFLESLIHRVQWMQTIPSQHRASRLASLMSYRVGVYGPLMA